MAAPRLLLPLALAASLAASASAIISQAALGPWSCGVATNVLDSTSVLVVSCVDNCASGASICEYALSDAIDAAFDDLSNSLSSSSSNIVLDLTTAGTPAFCDLLVGCLDSSSVKERDILEIHVESKATEFDKDFVQGSCNRGLTSLRTLRLDGVGGLGELSDLRKAVGKKGMESLVSIDFEGLKGFDLDLEGLASLSPDLEALRMVGVNFAAAAPFLGELTSLTHLVLHVFESSALQIAKIGIANMTSLEFLDLRGAGLRGSIVDLVSDLPETLVAFSIRNKISSEETDIHDNLHLANITDALLGARNSTQSLQYLQLSNCSLVGSVPEDLATLPGLMALDVSRNALEGAVPEALSTQLLLANFSMNRLDGTYAIPVSDFDVVVDVSFNNFTNLALADISAGNADLYASSEAGSGEVDLDALVSELIWLWNNTHITRPSYQRFNFAGNNMTCSCALLAAAWEVMAANEDAQDLGDTWTCTNNRATMAAQLELNVVDIAASPCSDEGAFASLDAFNFGTSDLVLEWSVRRHALDSVEVPASRNNAAKNKWAEFTTCEGCANLQSHIETTGTSPWNYDEFGFMVLVESTPVSRECCFVVPMTQSVTNYSAAVPVVDPSALKEATASVSAFSIRTPYESSQAQVYTDIAVATSTGSRPTGVSLSTNADSSLMLSFPELLGNRRRLAASAGLATPLANPYWELIDQYSGETLYRKPLPEKGYVDLKYYLLQGANAAVYSARIAENRSGVEQEIFSSTIGAYLSLRACPAGMGVVQAVNETTGRSQCEICPRDTYSTAELLVCALCPTGTMSRNTGAANSTECNIAAPGYVQDCVKDNATECTGTVEVDSCQSVMNCTLPGTTLGNMELVAGYWRASKQSLNIFKCSSSFCEPSHEEGRQFCSAKHEGFLCSRCREGYGFDQSGDSEVCLKCTENRRSQQIVVAVVVSMMFAVLAVLPLGCVASQYFRRGGPRATRDPESGDGAAPGAGAAGSSYNSRVRPRSSYHLFTKRVQSIWSLLWHAGAVKARIGLGFIQIYFCVAIFYVVDDMPLLDHVQRLNFVNVSCIMDATYYAWLVFYSAPTMLWVGGLLAAGLVARRVLPPFAYAGMRDRLYSWLFFMLVATVPFALWASLATFMCSEVEGNHILLISYATYCEGKVYSGWQVYACLVLTVVVFGGLLALVIPLYQHRALLRKGTWDPEEKAKAKWLAYLHGPYTNRAAWFEAFDFLRKFVLIAGVVALRPGPVPVLDDDDTTEQNAYEQGFVQIAYGLVCTIVSVFVLQFIQPYRNRFDAAFASLSQANLIAISIGAMLWTSSGANTSEKFRYSGALWAIIAFELISFVAITLYDAVHLTQYPDREDEMRVKLRRNFYHRTAQVTAPMTPGALSVQGTVDLEARYTPADRISWRHDSSSHDSLRGGGGGTFLPRYSQHSDAQSKAASYAQTPEQSNSFSREESDHPYGRRVYGAASPHDADGDAYTSDGLPSPGRMAIDVTAELEDQSAAAADAESAALLRSSRDFLLLDGIHFDTNAYAVMQVSTPSSKVGPALVLRDAPTKEHLVRLGVLGTGVSGTVYICLDRRNLHLVAVKEIALINASLATREVRALDLVRRFAGPGETADAAELREGVKHIIHMHNAFLDQDAQRIGVVVAFESGGSLQDVLESLREPSARVHDNDEVEFKLRTVLSSAAAQRPAPDLTRTLSGKSLDSEHFEQLEEGAVDIFGICNETMLAQVARGILAALAVLDELGLLHLDVKPANVLVSREGRVTLADFGLCQSISSYERKESVKVAGTLKYMSPERLRGARASHASDIWAFGITLLALVHGRYPITLGASSEEDAPRSLHGRMSASTNPGGETGGDGDGRDLYWKLLEHVGDAASALPSHARVCGRAGSDLTTVARVRFSDAFQDFVQKVLAQDPHARPSAKELLEHPWLQKRTAETPLLAPSTFDSSCQLLERASSALVASLPPRAAVSYSDAHVRCLGAKLGLSSEIVKYSLAVAVSERDDVTVDFNGAAGRATTPRSGGTTPRSGRATPRSGGQAASDDNDLGETRVAKV